MTEIYYADILAKDEMLKWLRNTFPNHTPKELRELVSFNYLWQGIFQVVFYNKEVFVAMRLIHGEYLMKNNPNKIPQHD